jgi:phage portal protein BeeE
MAAHFGTVRPRDGLLIPPPSPVGAYGLPGPYVYDTTSARRVPAVARAIQLYAGMCKQMAMDAYRGAMPLPRPRLLARPDPDNARSWFVGVSIEDYLLNGNAICLITERGADGWPLTVRWLPASWVYIVWNPPDPASVTYYLAGMGPGFILPPDDVVHVKRGADRWYPVRGVGIVEEGMSTLDRVAMEEEYERSTLATASVPSVAVIAPQAVIPQEVADQAKADWLSKFSGPVREPVILPAGSQVVPLAWSPSDTQLTEARRASLLDVANMFNLDGYWLGSPVAGMTYKTAGPQYQQILRTSIEPVIVDFEDVWSDAWLPRGTVVHFDRNQLLRDDMSTTALALSTLVGSKIITPQEARAYMALPITTAGAPADILQQVAPDTAPPADDTAPPAGDTQPAPDDLQGAGAGT